MILLGILADTHIPDRGRTLNPRLVSLFRSKGVAAILHAGDVCIPDVLAQLEDIAPIFAVRGNRDVYYLRHLPASQILSFEGVQIGLTHGHGRWRDYLADKARWFVQGIQEEHYRKRVLAAFPDADVIVFGHLHHPVNTWWNGKLIFNPGSATCPNLAYSPPTAGLLYLQDNQVQGAEILQLD